MSEQNLCRRCGLLIDRELPLHASYQDYTCTVCRTWERAMGVRGASNVVSEGLSVHGDTMEFNFWYPRSDGEPKYLTVGLYDVRAADDLRISYDFDRDGWKIEQAWIEEIEITEAAVTMKSGEIPRYFDHVDRWEEVAFVRAWDLNRQKGMAGPGTEENDA